MLRDSLGRQLLPNKSFCCSVVHHYSLSPAHISPTGYTLRGWNVISKFIAADWKKTIEEKFPIQLVSLEIINTTRPKVSAKL